MVRAIPPEELAKRVCAVCGSKTTYLRRSGRPNWMRWPKDKTKWMCAKCYLREVMWPRRKASGHFDDTNRILFRPPNGRMTHPRLPKSPRVGTCKVCGKTIASKAIKRTYMHHRKYDPNDVLAYTIELCFGCHRAAHSLIYLEELKQRGIDVSPLEVVT